MTTAQHRRPMSTWHLIVRSLAYHWRTQAAVALGVMAATTPTGSLETMTGPSSPSFSDSKAKVEPRPA